MSETRTDKFDVFALRYERSMDTFVMQYIEPAKVGVYIRRCDYPSDAQEVKTLRVRDLYAEIDRLRATVAGLEKALQVTADELVHWRSGTIQYMSKPYRIITDHTLAGIGLTVESAAARTALGGEAGKQ